MVITHKEDALPLISATIPGQEIFDDDDDSDDDSDDDVEEEEDYNAVTKGLSHMVITHTEEAP